MTSTSFNRKDMIPEREPPMSESGAIKWIRENLFGSIADTVMTLLSLYLLYALLSHVIPWVFFSTWNASSLQECRELAEGAKWTPEFIDSMMPGVRK